MNKSFEEMRISTIKPPRWGECMRTRWPGARGSHWVSSKTSIQFRLQFHSTFSFTNDYPTSANDPTKRAHSYVPKSVPQAQGAKCPYSLDLLCLAMQYHFTKSSKSHLHSCGAKPQLGEELANILHSLATRCCLVRAHLGSQVATSMAGRDSTSTMRCPGLGKARLHPGACSTAIWNKIMTSID